MKVDKSKITSTKYIANLLPKPNDNRSAMEKFASLPKEDREEWINKYAIKLLGHEPDEEEWTKVRDTLKYDWELWARPDQSGPENINYRVWAILSGRGY